MSIFTIYWVIVGYNQAILASNSRKMEKTIGWYLKTVV